MNTLHPMPASAEGLAALLSDAPADVLFLADPRVVVTPGPRMLERMAQALRDTGAGWVYSDAVGHPRIDCRPGSVRDTFDFGPVVAVSVPLARAAGLAPGLRFSALYDLRLRLSEVAPVLRVPEPLYASGPLETRPSGEAQFDYVDPRNREVQVEREQVATGHLARLGALLPPSFAPVPPCEEPFAGASPAWAARGERGDAGEPADPGSASPSRTTGMGSRFITIRMMDIFAMRRMKSESIGVRVSISKPPALMFNVRPIPWSRLSPPRGCLFQEPTTF